MITWKDIGDRSHFEISVIDFLNGNVPIEPPTFLIKVKAPDGTETTYEAERSDEIKQVLDDNGDPIPGKYAFDLVYTMGGGPWVVRFVVLDADGVSLGAEERHINVAASAFAQPLAPLP